MTSVVKQFTTYLYRGDWVKANNYGMNMFRSYAPLNPDKMMSSHYRYSALHFRGISVILKIHRNYVFSECSVTFIFRLLCLS